jgi:hypothetical protein
MSRMPRTLAGSRNVPVPFGRMANKSTPPRPLPLGSGFHLMWPRAWTHDAAELDAVLELELAAEGGRIVCERLTATRRPGGPPVTADVLKGLPVVGVVQMAATTWGLMRKVGRGFEPVTVEDFEVLPELELVAVLYRRAYAIGDNPTAAVASALGVTRDVAAKRVQAARRAGLLEPTTKGKKGA